MKTEINELLFDFVNYYIDLHGINKKYYIENETIVEEFLKYKNMEIQRRNQLDKCIPAELAIFTAMQEVEKVGADVKLTQAIQKLQEAKDLVSDYIDNPKRKLIIFVCTECGYACTLNEKDTEMINFLTSKTTHQHLEFGSRCSNPLMEMSESEYVGSVYFYKVFNKPE